MSPAQGQNGQRPCKRCGVPCIDGGTECFGCRMTRLDNERNSIPLAYVWAPFVLFVLAVAIGAYSAVGRECLRYETRIEQGRHHRPYEITRCAEWRYPVEKVVP